MTEWREPNSPTRIRLRRSAGGVEYFRGPDVPACAGVAPTGAVARSGDQFLHDGHIEPPVELAADLALDAHHLEPEPLVQGDRAS